jgi:hypothetical protein
VEGRTSLQRADVTLEETLFPVHKTINPIFAASQSPDRHKTGTLPSCCMQVACSAVCYSSDLESWHTKLALRFYLQEQNEMLKKFFSVPPGECCFYPTPHQTSILSSNYISLYPTHTQFLVDSCNIAFLDVEYHHLTTRFRTQGRGVISWSSNLSTLCVTSVRDTGRKNWSKVRHFCEISGSHGGEYEDERLDPSGM